MQKPPLKSGMYRVTRFCCQSALCASCHNRGNHGNLDKRKRVEHTAGVSKQWAEYVAHNWQAYGAKVEKIAP